MIKATYICQTPTDREYLRREIEILETLRRRGGVTLVMDGESVITAYANDRRVRR